MCSQFYLSFFVCLCHHSGKIASRKIPIIPSKKHTNIINPTMLPRNFVIPVGLFSIIFQKILCYKLSNIITQGRGVYDFDLIR